MRSCSDYIFAIEGERADGERLDQVPVDIRWRPLEEGVRLKMLGAGLPWHTGLRGECRILPVWDDKSGAPYVVGVRAVNGSVYVQSDPLFFATAVREVSQRWIAQGKLGEGDTFSYRLLAFPAPVDAMKCCDEEDDEWLVPPIADATISEFLREAQAVDDANSAELPVFVAANVISDAIELTQRAGDIEAGGVLLGRILRDRSKNYRTFISITALVELRKARGTTMSFSFSPAVWDEISSIVALRGGTDVILGFEHSHPFWCRNCTAEKRRVCPLRTCYFSEDDRFVMTTAFPAAYQVGLVVKVKEDSMEPALFTWTGGVVKRRGYFVCGKETA